MNLPKKIYATKKAIFLLRRCSIAVFVLVTLGGASNGATFAAETRALPPEKYEKFEGLSILVDAIHCHDFSETGMQENNYDYHEICGFFFGYEYLKTRGIQIERAEKGRLTPELLAKHDMLAINLISADKSVFLVPEIFAIRDYVKNGGSLFVVTDHSNCYFHANALEPLFEELEIETTRHTACDRGKNTLSTGNAWLLVSRFDPHPITEGLRRLGVQTGGTVDSRYAVAWTSDRAWADNWFCPPYLESRRIIDLKSEKKEPQYEITGPGLYGNFTQDPDEPTGKLGVLLAKEFGKGRIVIVNDQNMLADTFINYADNYRLWLNAFAWLLREEKLKDPVPYRLSRKPAIWVVENFNSAEFGSDSQHGMFYTWVTMNRYFWPFANDRGFESSELAVLAEGYSLVSEETIQDLAAHLRRGKNILSLHTESEVFEASGSVIGGLLEQFGIENPTTEKSGDIEILKVPEGGKIFLIGGLELFSNQTIPPSTNPPNEEEQKTIARLRELIQMAL